MKKLLIILILSVILVAGCNKYNKFEDWKNNSLQVWKIDFEHPYIHCIFDKTCNGSVHLYINYNPTNLSNEEIKSILSKYGEIDKNFQDDIAIDNIDNLTKLLNLDFVNITYTYILSVDSDYKINDTEIKKCNSNLDCGFGDWACCPRCIPINKNYTTFWNMYYHIVDGAHACIPRSDFYWDSKCIDYQCQSIMNITRFCNSADRYDCIQYMMRNKNIPTDDFCINISKTCKDIAFNYSKVIEYDTDFWSNNY